MAVVEFVVQLSDDRKVVGYNPSSIQYLFHVQPDVLTFFKSAYPKNLDVLIKVT